MLYERNESYMRVRELNLNYIIKHERSRFNIM